MTKTKKDPILSLPLIDTKSKVYNDMDKYDHEELMKPFEDQLFGMPKDHVKSMSLNQDDRVWLLRKDDIRDRIVKADLQEYIDGVYNNTSKMLVSQLGEVLDAHWARTNEIVDKLTGKVDSISSDIKDMKGNFERRIVALEKTAKYHEELNKKDAELEKQIRSLAETGFIKRPWYTRPFWMVMWKIIEIVTLTGLLAFLHNKYWR